MPNWMGRMTLDECREAVGRQVIYRPAHGANPEQGIITSVGEVYVFVRYGDDQHSKATAPGDLKLAIPDDMLGDQP